MTGLFITDDEMAKRRMRDVIISIILFAPLILVGWILDTFEDKS
jgi:hypothetical protein